MREKTERNKEIYEYWKSSREIKLADVCKKYGLSLGRVCRIIQAEKRKEK